MSRLDNLFSRWESQVTPSTKKVATKRKSAKAQRATVKSTKSVSDQHSCWLYGTDDDNNQLTGAIAHCPVCMATSQLPVEVQGWAPPAPFDTWVKRNYGLVFATPNAALDAGQSDVVVAYNNYVKSVFDQPFTRSVFDRIVRREYAKQVQGLGDLGLLGYSADDIVDLAVFYAWAERVKSYVRAIGADDETAAHISQALRDFRSDDQLREVADLEGDGRYVFGHDDRLRKQDNSLAVRHARERLALRAELRESGLLDGFDYVPTAGQVYRQVKHVFREGMREWRNAIEGLSRDGVMPESIESSDDVRIAVGQIVAPDYFTVTEVDQVTLTREAWIDAYKERTDLVPAEATALAVTEALMQGFKLFEIREHFNSETAFRRAIADARTLFAIAA